MHNKNFELNICLTHIKIFVNKKKPMKNNNYVCIQFKNAIEKIVHLH